MDFKIVDEVTDPKPRNDGWYAERLYRLPRPFACYAPAPTVPPVGPAPCERNGFVTFGCFNRRTKIQPPMMALWAEILRRSPSSRLLFHFPIAKDRQLPPAIRDPIARFFRARGISSRRLEFYGYRPIEEHLSLVSSADIALDTFPYAGMTITLDCLWMGTPVVTLAGGAHVSRTGTSMLTCLDLRDWIARSPKQYVEIAVRKARNASGLAGLRRNLRPSMANSPLTDSADYIRSLERAFTEMLEAVGGVTFSSRAR
jgi:predicted O-linked N-acetylglucosamine transferase (SPINDLY family)